MAELSSEELHGCHILEQLRELVEAKGARFTYWLDQRWTWQTLLVGPLEWGYGRLVYDQSYLGGAPAIVGEVQRVYGELGFVFRLDGRISFSFNTTYRVQESCFQPGGSALHIDLGAEGECGKLIVQPDLMLSQASTLDMVRHVDEGLGGALIKALHQLPHEALQPQPTNTHTSWLLALMKL